MNVPALLETYKVDLPHAHQVAHLALALFDAVAKRYALPAEHRRLVEIGALLHNVGMTTDPPAHHLVGRDIVLRHEVEDLTLRERALVACMVVFHRKRVRPQIEPAYLALGKKGQREALRLAAILRVADGLDYAQSQSTALAAVEPVEGGLLLRLAGPHAAGDGARAVAKADLWAKVFGEHLRATPSVDAARAPTGDSAAPAGDGAPETPAGDDEAGAPETPAGDDEAGAPEMPAGDGEAGAPEMPAGDGEAGEAEAPTLAPWYADPEAPLAELGRVLLRRHLRRLLTAQRDVRADKEIEHVHALRVATRRLRATLRLLQPVYRAGGLREHAKAIGRLARAAGAVRDRDVLLADLEARGGGMPAALAPSVEALADTIREQRRKAHADLLDFLDDDAHADFLRAFAAAMNSPERWDDTPRVRDRGGSTIWSHYEALRAHDRGGLPGEIEAIHAMRIDGKRMRYVLELFADTLGERAEEAIKPLMAFQDHLGALNDIAVARHLLTPLAADERAGPAAAAYLAARDQEGERLARELPARWERLNSGTYRRKLMELIVRL